MFIPEGAAGPILVRGVWLLVVIFFDVVLGMVTALYQGRFRVERLPDFLKDYGPAFLVWAVLEVLAVAPVEVNAVIQLTPGAAGFVYASVILGAVASILGHAQALGLPVNLARFGLPATGDNSQK